MFYFIGRDKAKRLSLNPLCLHQRLRLKRFVVQSVLGLGQLRCSQAVHRHGFRKREKKILPGIPGSFGPHWESAFGLGRLYRWLRFRRQVHGRKQRSWEKVPWYCRCVCLDRHFRCNPCGMSYGLVLSDPVYIGQYRNGK